ncbi:MAG TPA: carboxypeptidase-like regulatory domain-containing protein [Candidatus Sulfotelmatobacter sp.]|nr:carboxypeptidase-like regulatory domain-containing protein [Candidatus Sulfotelmatobacter sp.]
MIPLFLFFLFLALFAAVPARAGTAVITFTNFPSVVSNTYPGVITLQISGLTNGVTNVVVQKYLDVNTNGFIDSADLLVQQFQLTVGQASVFTNEPSGTPVIVTNFMPGDMTSVTGQITAPLNFQNGDFAQNLVGQYLYKISSPSGQFTPVTNLFVVTNTFFSSLVTGTVVNASSPTFAPVTNAMVLLCVTNGGLKVLSGTVTSTNGFFSLRAPPAPTGGYTLAAAVSNFVSPFYALSLSAKQTNNFGDLGLYPAQTNITGRIINAANSNGLAGISGMMVTTNGSYFSLFFTDTNGNFHAPVMITNAWGVQVNPFAATFQGCLTWQTNLLLNISNNTVSFTNALPPATAVFYGVVSNSAAQPMPGVYVISSDTAGHQSLGMTDQHGNYLVGALAETNAWQWSIFWPNNPGLGFTNTYVFSPGYVDTNDLQFDQAVPQNFSLLTAFYTIGGAVSDADGNPIVGAVVLATNGTYESFSATTASDGSYSLDVSSGPWTVGIVPGSLESLGYTNIPANQTTNVSDANPNVTVNFIVVACNEIEIFNTNLPDATVGDYYETNIDADSCQNITNWFPAYGLMLTSLNDQTNFTYPAGTPIYSDSNIVGYVETYFSFSFQTTDSGVTSFETNCNATLVQDTAAGNDKYYFDNIYATIKVTGPIAQSNQVTFSTDGGGATVWTASPTTQNADGSYSDFITLSRLPPSGAWYYSGNFTCAAGSMMYDTTMAVQTNLVGTIIGDFHSIPTLGISGVAASSLPYNNLNNSPVWIIDGTNMGQYFISAYGPQTTNLPPGLSLIPDGPLGIIEGTPTASTTNGIFYFTVAAEDSAGNIAVQPLSMFVYPGTAISGPTSSQVGMLRSSNTFQMQVNGVTPGFGYTVLMTTNLASPNWVSIYSTNAVSTNSFTVPDTAATNTARFYRLEISPPGS